MENKASRRRKQKGLTMIVTVMALGVIIPFVGLAIDASLLYAIKAKMQAAVDSAALSGARSLNVGMDLSSQVASATATAQAFFNANFPSGHLGTTNCSVTINVAESSYRTRTVATTASLTAPTYFMRLLGVQNRQLRASGTASRRDVNMVLVLDRSSSMSGVMTTMKSAARDFVSKFAEGRDNVGLIVFGGSSVLAFPNPSPIGPESDFKSSSPSVDTLISQMVNGGNTGTAQAIWLAYQELVKRNDPGALNLIVFFTDGLPNGLVGEFNDPNSSKNLLRTTSTCTYRLVSNRSMLGFLSQTSGFAPTGTTVGIKKLTASTVSSVSEGYITTNSNNCYYNGDETKMRQDVLKMPNPDYYGNATTGYHSVDLTKVDSPQQIGYASLNAADSAVQRIRQDNSLNVVIYTIGYAGGSEVPDETWMKRISNDPSSASYTSSEPTGLYIMAPSTGDLSAAFARVASEILRLSL